MTTSMTTNTGPLSVPSSQSKVKLTPLMTQYWDVKSAHEDKIVLFRMGDFYEMFHRDAETAAPVLGIALTARNKKSADETPMCGVPYHSIANSINKLLQNGFKIAICDQVEDPKLAKGLVKRAVTRILSPGVVYDPETLDRHRANYLASVDSGAVSFLDPSTGEAFYFQVPDADKRLSLLESLAPVEIVVPSTPTGEPSVTVASVLVSHHDQLHDEILRGPAQLPESARRLLSYVVTLQGQGALKTISPFMRRELQGQMNVPPTTLRHLEIFSTYRSEVRGSLFHAIDRTKTSAGARLLRSWLSFPLLNVQAINRRLDRVERWTQREPELKSLRLALSGMGDMQRRVAKLSSPSVHPRDLQALADGLRAGLEVSRLADDQVWDPHLLATATEILAKIETTLVEEPPLQLKSGGVIRKGLNSELDEWIELSTNSHQLILNLEAKERELTGISSLKIRFNQVFGYSIEITHTHKDRVPKDRYERRQTLANAERYQTPELAALETKVLSAQARRVELEMEIFHSLVKAALAESRKLLDLALLWAEVDVISSLSAIALERNYCRPRVEEGGILRLVDSRHPVVEQTLQLPFVANDVALNRGGCLLLTGPNMAGKSTLMRQVALSALMAQVGSFVAASEAELPLFDQIFTRIGASDSLSEGLSTFMVEMKESAQILAAASKNSLVILDEIGRGTSTYDGLSLAQAILEFLVENKRCLSFFATHYHELTELAAHHARLECGHMRIHENDGRVTFLHQLARGPASKSYGIHVAELAGLPTSVTRRAASILKRLESKNQIASQQMSLIGQIDRESDEQETEIETELGDVRMSVPGSPAGPTTEPKVDDLLASLRALEVSRLTPLDALNQICKWQQSLS